MTMTDLEQRIRDRAHQIWEAEGQPEGAQDRHWEQARLEIEAEERIGSTDTDADTELTSSLATADDPVGALAEGEPAPAVPAPPAAKPARKRPPRKASPA